MTFPRSCFRPMLPVWTTVNGSVSQPSRSRASVRERGTALMCDQFGSTVMRSSGTPYACSVSRKLSLTMSTRSADVSALRSSFAVMPATEPPPLIPVCVVAFAIRSCTTVTRGTPCRRAIAAAASGPPSAGVTATTTSGACRGRAARACARNVAS